MLGTGHRRVARGFADPRVRRLPVLRLHAMARFLVAEFAETPVVAATTLLVAAAAVAFVALHIVELARASERSALLLAGAGVGLLMTVHRMRADRGFLKRVGISPRALFLVEYLPALLPLAVLLGWSGRPLPALLTLLAAPALAVMPSGWRLAAPRVMQRRFQLLLPTRAFEWIGATRRLWFLFVGTGALLLIGSSLAPASIWPSLGALAVLTYIGSDAYLSPPAEDWVIVHAFMETPHAFLGRKLALGLATYCIFAAVPLLVLVVMQPTTDRAATGALATLAGAAAIVGAVLTKYCIYLPGERAATLVIAVSMGAWLTSIAVAPVLVPLLAILLWRGAVRQLAPFLPSPRKDEGEVPA